MPERLQLPASAVSGMVTVVRVAAGWAAAATGMAAVVHAEVVVRDDGPSLRH